MLEGANLYPNETDLGVKETKLVLLKVRVAQEFQEMGSDLGDDHLNFLNPSLLPTDSLDKAIASLDRATRVTQVRQFITEVLSPTIDQVIETTQAEIDIQNSRGVIQQRVETLRPFTSLLTEAELRSLEASIGDVYTDIHLIDSVETNNPTDPESPENLPKITINNSIGRKEVTINGNTKRFRNGVTWEAVLFFAKNANRDISQEEIEELAKAIGSNATDQAGNIIYLLRRALEVNPEDPKILMAVQNPESNTFLYRLNAEVELIDKAADEMKGIRSIGNIHLDPGNNKLRIGESEEVHLIDSEVVLMNILINGGVERQFPSHDLRRLLIEKGVDSNPGTLIGSLKNKLQTDIFLKDGKTKSTKWSLKVNTASDQNPPSPAVPTSPETGLDTTQLPVANDVTVESLTEKLANLRAQKPVIENLVNKDLTDPKELTEIERDIAEAQEELDRLIN